MVEHREINLIMAGGIGNCDCPFCEVANALGFRNSGEYDIIIASCEHLQSVRHGSIGETKEKGFFARFEKRKGD